MISVLIISALLIASSGCILLSLLPMLAHWSNWLQIAASVFGLAGIGGFLYCMFKNC